MTKTLNHRLSEDEVIEIKDLLALGEKTRDEIAADYGVEVTAIKRISAGRTWAHVEGPEPKRKAHKATDTQIVEELVRRRKDGEHVKAIASDLGIDWSTAYRLLRKLKKETVA